MWHVEGSVRDAMADGAAPPTHTFARHDPTTSVLFGVVRAHLASFVAGMREAGAALPRYVEQEFQALLGCGVLANGFARVRCDGCGFERLVAFSCKRRGVCASCGGRRMAETAARLVDGVLPAVGLRQWVLTVPWELRLPMARDPTLYTKVSQTLFAAVRAWLRATSGVVAGDGEKVEVGAVAVQHRSGGSLNLSPHWHMLMLDGVYRCRDDGSTPVFVPVRAPSRDELEAILADVVSRLARSRRWRAMGDDLDGDEDAMTRLLRGAAEGGARYTRLDGQDDRDDDSEGGPRGREGDAVRRRHDAARVQGFNLHASVAIAAGDADGRERLCRYVLRPAVSAARFSMLEDGRIAYRVKYPRSAKATHLVMTPMECMARLAALVPPPRVPLVRYQGVLAPNSPWRGAVVPWPSVKASCGEGSGHHAPRGCDDATAAARGALGGASSGDGVTPTESRRERRDRENGRIDWATLLRRVWGVDVLACVRCGDRLRRIAVIEDPAVIARILAHVGLDPVAPRAARARAEPWDDSS